MDGPVSGWSGVKAAVVEYTVQTVSKGISGADPTLDCWRIKRTCGDTYMSQVEHINEEVTYLRKPKQILCILFLKPFCLARGLTVSVISLKVDGFPPCSSLSVWFWSLLPGKVDSFLGLLACYTTPWFSTRAGFITRTPRGHLAMWRHFYLSKLRGVLLWASRVCSCQTSLMHRAAPTMQCVLAQCPWCRGWAAGSPCPCRLGHSAG